MTGKWVIPVQVQWGIFWLCVEKAASELFYQLPKMAGDWTGSVRDVCLRLLCQLIAISEQFLCGYRLIID